MGSRSRRENRAMHALSVVVPQMPALRRGHPVGVAISAALEGACVEAIIDPLTCLLGVARCE